MRVLVIRLSAMGDVLLTLPVLRAVKSARPDLHLTLLTDARFEPLVTRTVDDVWAWSPDVWRRVRLARFDAVVDLQHKARTMLLSSLSGAPQRFALQRRTWRELARAASGRDVPSAKRHAVERYTDVFQKITFAIPAKCQRGDRRENLVALAPGAAHSTKRWPAERFAEVGDAFASEGYALALVGGAGDDAQLSALAALLRTPPLVDARGWTLAASAELLARCALLIGNDSGLAHLATEQGTPVVAVFGPTSPRRWQPYGEAARAVSLELACSPCTNHGGAVCPLGHHACLQDLSADHVLNAARALLAAAT